MGCCSIELCEVALRGAGPGWTPSADTLNKLFDYLLVMRCDAQLQMVRKEDALRVASGRFVRVGPDYLRITLDELVSAAQSVGPAEGLRTLGWFWCHGGYGIRVVSSDEPYVHVSSLVELREGIDRALKDIEVSMAKKTEQAAKLIEEARGMTEPGAKMARLAEAVRLAEEAGAPLVKAVANSMRAQIAAATGSQPSALAYAESALATMREAGLPQETHRLEKLISAVLAATTATAADDTEAIPTDIASRVVVAGSVEKKERDWIMAMKEKVTTAAVTTGVGAKDAFLEGLAISGSQQISDRIVKLFHERLGHHVPMAASPLGQQVERLLIPAFVHFAAGMMPEKIPGAQLVQQTCMRAITGVAKDDGDAVIKALVPMFAEVAKMATADGVELASMLAGEMKIEQISGQESKALAAQSQAGALTAALQQQFDAAEEGEEIVVSIKKKSASKRNGKAQKGAASEEKDYGVVPPFEPAR